MKKKSIDHTVLLKRELATIGITPPEPSFVRLLKEGIIQKMREVSTRTAATPEIKRDFDIVRDFLKDVSDESFWSRMPLQEFSLLHPNSLHPTMAGALQTVRAHIVGVDIDIDLLSGKHTPSGILRAIEAFVFVKRKGARLYIGSSGVGYRSSNSFSIMSSKKGIEKFMEALDLPEGSFEEIQLPQKSVPQNL
ncbi:MAG: hypothetical protein AAB400_04010 [Patescibacteria group bacterium]